MSQAVFPTEVSDELFIPNQEVKVERRKAYLTSLKSKRKNVLLMRRVHSPHFEVRAYFERNRMLQRLVGDAVTEANSDEGKQELDVSDGSNVSSEPFSEEITLVSVNSQKTGRRMLRGNVLSSDGDDDIRADVSPNLDERAESNIKLGANGEESN